MDRLQPLAWAAIAVIVIVIVVVNIWLVALLRSKELPSRSALSSRRMPRGLSIESAQKLVRVLRNPFGEEQQNLQQLSKMVKDLQDKQDHPS